VLVIGINSKEELNKFIRQQGLIDDTSLLHCQSLAPPASTYFGIGLCNSHCLSRGLPIDVLSMVLASEAVANEKRILIADTHANGNGFERAAVNKVAQQTKEKLEKVIDNLNFGNWIINCASEIDQGEDYKDIFHAINGDNEYIRRELADMEWFRSHGVNLKVGWRLNGRRDETFFDRKFEEVFGDTLSFLYLKPGRTLEISRPRAPPYICTNSHARILLDEEQDVASKLAAESFRSNGAKKYFRNLILLYNRVTGERINEKNVAEGVQELLTECLK